MRIPVGANPPDIITVVTVTAQAPVTWAQSLVTDVPDTHALPWWALLFGVGVLVFVVDVLRHAVVLRRLHARTTAEERFTLPDGTPTLLRLVDSPIGGMVSGLSKPTIWASASLRHAPAFATLLAHESRHIIHRDHCWIWLLALGKRLLWWNPFAWIFAAWAARYMEQSCDAACVQQMGVHNYRRDLAFMIQSHALASQPGFAGLADHRMNLNIQRLKILGRKSTMKPHHLLILATILTVGLALLAKPRPSPVVATSNVPSVGSPDVTPPVIIKRVKPVPPIGQSLNGYVILELIIDKSGKPKDIKILRSLDEAYDQAAVDAASQWAFEPGMFRGELAEVRMALKMDFIYESPAVPLAIISPDVDPATITPPSLSARPPSKSKHPFRRSVPARFWVNTWGDIEDLQLDLFGEGFDTEEIDQVKLQWYQLKLDPASIDGIPVRVQVQGWIQLGVDHESHVDKVPGKLSQVAVPLVRVNQASLKEVVLFIANESQLNAEFLPSFEDDRLDMDVFNGTTADLLTLMLLPRGLSWGVCKDQLFLGDSHEVKGAIQACRELTP